MPLRWKLAELGKWLGCEPASNWIPFAGEEQRRLPKIRAIWGKRYIEFSGRSLTKMIGYRGTIARASKGSKTDLSARRLDDEVIAVLEHRLRAFSCFALYAG
jgi:hypothetical protein